VKLLVRDILLQDWEGGRLKCSKRDVLHLLGLCGLLMTISNFNSQVNFMNTFARGTSIGEAILQARKYCKEIGHGNQSWLSYQQYGNPNAYIKIG
jgi:hypothetical protein